MNLKDLIAMQKPQSTLQTPHQHKHTEKQLLDLATLRQNNSLLPAHYDTQNVATANQAIIAGQLRFVRFDEGFSMHGGKFEELANLNNQFELPAGLSLNWVFGGALRFSTENSQYCLTNTPPQANAIALVSKTSLCLSRPMTQGNHIEKLNLFASKSWLRKHASSPQEYTAINALFSGKNIVARFNAKNQNRQLAQYLHRHLVNDTHSGFFERGLAMQLLSLSIQQLAATLPQTIAPISLPNTQNEQLKEDVTRLSQRGQNVGAIASSLNMSISTLQRQFKKHYGITVADYLKQRKLEQARQQIIEGKSSIDQVAHCAGYNHTANFIAAFKKFYGITPKAMRDQTP